ncbi:MAG: hypothetical protein ACE37J_06860 [Pikeienuella sp.]|uniref:hypothetical protein n=1 Tax=Pikeienuella sp. TaxID=2831957 RepID=UPI00391BECEB
MNPVTTGVVVAIAIVAVFIAGVSIDFGGGYAPINVEIGGEGPLERAGEALDDAAKAATE